MLAAGIILLHMLRAAPLPDRAKPVSSAAFKEVSAQFLAHYSLYRQDRRTMPFQIAVLDRHFGEMAFRDITITDLETFFAARLAAGTTYSTCNRNLSAASMLWKWAVRRGHTERNIVAEMPRFPERPAEARYLTGEELHRLVMAAAPHLKAYLVTLAYSGGRMTETLRLRWGRVDFSADSLTFVKESTKGKKSRTIPMPPPLREALLALRPGRPDDFVFLYNQRPVASMRTALRTAAKRAGLGRVGFHSLRHAFGHHFIERGGPVIMLQRLLGHGSIGVTMRYVHTSPSYLAGAVDFMGPPGLRATTKRYGDPPLDSEK